VGAPADLTAEDVRTLSLDEASGIYGA